MEGRLFLSVFAFLFSLFSLGFAIWATRDMKRRESTGDAPK